MKRILVVEDDVAMRQALVALLISSNYGVISLAFPDEMEDHTEEKRRDDAVLTNKQVQTLRDFSTTECLRAICESQADLVLLDLNLPNQNGAQLLKALREESEIPVIMLTSSNSETDEVLSMSYGADDYVTKPYSPSVLLLRIGAVLRRSDTPSKLIKLHGLKIDLARGVIVRDSEPNMPKTKTRALLTKNEMIILRHLLEHQGEIVTRDALMTDLWNNQEYINDNALTVNISRLRNKLNALGAGDAIETRKGLGYLLS